MFVVFWFFGVQMLIKFISFKVNVYIYQTKLLNYQNRFIIKLIDESRNNSP